MLFGKKHHTLVEQAMDEFLQMIQHSHNMFGIVTEALVEKVEGERLATIKNLDKQLNKMHRNVRKKIFEHLSITGSTDLPASLVILTVVNDSERIGDYTKNIIEIVEMLPYKLEFGKYRKQLDNIWRNTDLHFTMTLEAFKEDDEEKAYNVVRKCKSNAKKCESVIQSILTEDGSDKVKRDYIALILLMRYFKRVNAHLKNIASTVVNPFHRIGYKPQKKKQT